jgi:hypothetical protein
MGIDGDVPIPAVMEQKYAEELSRMLSDSLVGWRRGAGIELL